MGGSFSYLMIEYLVDKEPIQSAVEKPINQETLTKIKKLKLKLKQD